MKRRAAWFFSGSILFAVAAWAAPGLQQSAKLPRPGAAILYQEDSKAVYVVRFVNTAERDYRFKENKFANWEELMNSAYFLAHRGQFSERTGLALSNGTDIIPGWELSLVTSADGGKYELMMLHAKDRCSDSFFSNDSGLIFKGKAIGCAASVPASKG